ncbi:hypothetical protein ACIP93_00740 [Streptomyces sp. NPDC088745]|uniref:hypothetical protein n=1 Tax=Streptomyces sp. NPDC088745 TaxID=3365884 RepID=UPI0038084905
MGHLPAPRLRRIAKVIAIDLTHRIALLPQETDHPKWALPQQTALLDETYTDTVSRLCEDLFPTYPTRNGTVVGRRWATAPEGPTLRVETHFHIVRVDAEPADDIPSQRILWAPRTIIGLWLQASETETAKILIDGYLDGWLPDGPITLD